MSPARTSAAGKIDEISATLGRLEAYTHEHRHEVKNVSQKMDALSLDVAQRVETLRAEMTVRINEAVHALTSEHTALATRVGVLELSDARQGGERGLLSAFLNNPIVAAIVAALAGALGWLLGSAHR